MGRVIIASALLLATAVLLGSCGSSGDVFWEDHSETYESVYSRDGWVRSDGGFNAAGGGPIVGDLDFTSNGRYLRVIYSFDTGGISTDAEIQSARLRVFQEGIMGGPYAAGQGDLVVDHMNMGLDLDFGDLTGGTLASNIGTLSTNTTAEWKELDVTAAVQSAVSADLDHTDLRLHFVNDSNGNNVTDYIRVNDGGDSESTGHIPTLIVEYRAPRL